MEFNKKVSFYFLILGAVFLVFFLIYRYVASDNKKSSVESMSSLALESGEEDIVEIAETSPLFPGCEDQAANPELHKTCSEEKLINYLYSKIKYPEYALQHDIEGRCVISFVVEKNGTVSNVKILKDIGGGCGEEALRVVNSMNDMPQRWIPGKNKGELVRVRFNLPVKFQLEEKKEGK